MRSIWKGSVSFGLVSVPVKLYGATDDHDIKAHQVHAADGGQIRYKKVCEKCGKQVEQADLAKAYDHNDQRVILTDDDLATIAEEANRTIEVLEFIPAGDLDPMMYDKPYYLGPEKDKGAQKAYRLLTSALARTERVALVQFAMRGKTRLAALTVTGKEEAMVAYTLRWPDEIREFDLSLDVEVKDAELDLAETLIESMANEFNPDRYRDTYQTELAELIAAKWNGETLPSREDDVVDTADVEDLLAKLQASVGKRTAKK